jgi:uridine kinase
VSTSSPRVVIGVAGGTGSGKTLLVQEIMRQIGPDSVTRIQHDSYYLDRSGIPAADRLAINYDHPDALETSLLVDHVRTLRSGRAAEVPLYDFATHTRRAETVRADPRRTIIIEGILVLAEPALRDLMDIRVFVDTDADLRILRRLKRDMAERRRTLESIVQQYLETVRPMHLEFVEPSKRHAHVIIPEGGRNEVAIDMLIAKIRAVMSAD